MQRTRGTQERGRLSWRGARMLSCREAGVDAEGGSDAARDGADAENLRAKLAKSEERIEDLKKLLDAKSDSAEVVELPNPIGKKRA